MSLVNINWQPEKKQLREFGIAMLVGFGIIGMILWFGVFPFKTPRETWAMVCWGFGLICGLTGLTGTRAALPFYYLWMGFAFVMGSVVSRVLVALVFFLVITPIGLLGRLVGRDRLQLKRQSEESYWVDIKYNDDPRRYRRQF